MDKLSLDNFNWGWMNESSESGLFHKEHIISEIFIQEVYERFFRVNEGDIVLDIGASNGPFTYSILHKKPKHVYCLEPSQIEFPVLIRNTCGYPVTPINKGISNTDFIETNNKIFGGGDVMESITFPTLCKLYNLSKIDFLKTDCEGGEYHIFNLDNLDYIKSNIKYIVGEWHLGSLEMKSKFRNFRDVFLPNFSKVNVFSVDGVNIKWDLYNEHFLEYYTEVIVYLDNS